MFNNNRIYSLRALNKIAEAAEAVKLNLVKDNNYSEQDDFMATAQFAQEMLTLGDYYTDTRKKKVEFVDLFPTEHNLTVIRILKEKYDFSSILSLDLESYWHLYFSKYFDSSFLEWLLYSFADQYDKDELQWYCVDVWNGGKSFGGFSQVIYNCKDNFHKGVYIGDEDLSIVLRELENTIKTNMSLLQGKYRSVEQYNSEHNKKIPYTIAVICDIDQSNIYELDSKIKWIQENSSAAGIHLIMSTEKYKNPQNSIEVNKLYYSSLDKRIFNAEIRCSGYISFKARLTRKIIRSEHYENLISKLNKTTVIDTRFESHSASSKEYFTMDSTEMLRIPFAIDSENKIQYLELGGKAPAHGLMSGTTGSGKSVTLHTIIQGITMNYHPDDVEIWAIDYKAVEFNCYADKKTPHIRVIGQDNSIDFSISLLELANKEYEKRKKMFVSAGVNNFAAFRAKYGTRSLPRIFIIIDEFHNLTQAIMQYDGDKDYRLILENLLKETRAMGMTFFFCSQIISSGLDGLTDAARNQIGCRMCMLQSDLGEIRETLALPATTSFNLESLTTLATGQIYYKKVKTDLSTGAGYELNCYNVLYISEEQRSTLIDEINAALGDDYKKKEDIISRGSDRYPVKEKIYHTLSQFVEGEDFDNDELTYFFAAPKTLDHEFKIELSDESGSNVLLIGENDDLRESIIMHSVMGLLMDPMNQITVSVLNPDNDDQARLIQHLNRIDSSRLRIASGTKETLDVISSLKKLKPLRNTRKIYFWYGMNKLKNAIFQLVQDEEETEEIPVVKETTSQFTLNDHGLADLQSLLAEMDEEVSTPQSKMITTEEILDYKEYIKILQNLAEYGPDNNCYSFAIYNQVKQWAKAGIDRLEDYEHRIGLRMSTDDAYNLYGTYLIGDGIDEKSALYHDGSKYGKMLLPYAMPDEEWMEAYNRRIKGEE